MSEDQDCVKGRWRKVHAGEVLEDPWGLLALAQCSPRSKLVALRWSTAASQLGLGHMILGNAAWCGVSRQVAAAAGALPGPHAIWPMATVTTRPRGQTEPKQHNLSFLGQQGTLLEFIAATSITHQGAAAGNKRRQHCHLTNRQQYPRFAAETQPQSSRAPGNERKPIAQRGIVPCTVLQYQAWA